MIGSSFMPPSAICCCSDSSVRRPPRAPSARSFACVWRKVAICRALAASATVWNASPGCGRLVRPSTSTGVDGPADFTGRPRSSISARTRADHRAGDEVVADVQRAVLHQHGRHRTAAAIELRFEHRARRAALRVGLELEDVGRRAESSRAADRGSASSSPDTGTMTVVPPQSSGTRFSSASSRLTLSGLAPGLSILLIATTIGTLAAFAWSIASRVCGMTPSSAATTSTTTSVTLAPRARISVNAS